MIHILGIAGTFMAGVATLAQEAGVDVSGSDAQIYPPMSTLLETLGIEVSQGYEQTDLLSDKQIIIGNALSRGNPSVEYTLDNKLPHTSGPQWLHENVLRHKDVMGVAGTHGKTTTSSILAWILHRCGKHPGFLIGGKPGNFDQSAKLGSGDFFVVEADEYDTAFFDKRSKFVHYHPKIAILNNLEFDHADIFPNIEAIKTQFHHLVRTIPQNGALIINADDSNLADVIQMGCWTPREYFSIKDNRAEWFARAIDDTVQAFTITHKSKSVEVSWNGLGEYNMANALAAVAAATHAGVKLEDACEALASFIFPNKRLQSHATQSGFTLIEDFAHHPTAVRNAISALRKAYPDKRIISVLELRSNTMRMGTHQTSLADSMRDADTALVIAKDKVEWLLSNEQDKKLSVFENTKQCEEKITQLVKPEDIVIIMSNGDIGGMIGRLAKL